MGTPQGAVSREHLDAYLNEFAFRFNRRTARHRGLLFFRLLEHAVEVSPVRYESLVRYGKSKRTIPQSPAAAGLPLPRPAPSSPSLTGPGEAEPDNAEAVAGARARRRTTGGCQDLPSPAL